MRILLTGATGYLGSHLAQTFVDSGHSVIVLKRSSSRLDRLEGLLDKIVAYDIEGLDFSAPFSNHGSIDVVVHVATCYGRKGENIHEIFHANTAFPLEVLNAAVNSGTKYFINTDTSLPHDINIYARTKNWFALLGEAYVQDKLGTFVNLRLEHFYGPGDDESKFISWIINSCQSNVPEISLTKGEQLRDFIFIDDVVTAYNCILKNLPTLGDGYHEIDVGSGECITLQNVVKKVHELTQSHAKLNFGALPYRQHELMETKADTSKLRELGWTCKTTFTDGIRSLTQNGNNISMNGELP